MKTKIFLALIIFQFIFLGQSFAQDKKMIKSHTIGWYPLTLFDNGLSFDYEQRIDSSKNWLNIRLSGFYAPENSNYDWITFNSGFEEYNSMKGMGLGLSYKSFFDEKMRFYWSGGTTYNFYNINYYGGSYEPLNEDGLIFYEYIENMKSQKFNKLGANVNIGMLTSWETPLFVDVYLSLGYAYSFYDKNKCAYNDTMHAFGYRGFTVSIGGRIGLGW